LCRITEHQGTVAWYTHKLGFHVDKVWPFGELKLAYLSRGSAKIEILGGGDAAPQPRFDEIGASFGDERLHHFCLAVDDLDAVIEELSRRDVSLVGEPFVVDEIGRRLAFVEDNSGNLVSDVWEWNETTWVDITPPLGVDMTGEERDQLRQRLVREAGAAGKMSHPNLVTVYQLGWRLGGKGASGQFGPVSADFLTIRGTE